MNVGLRFIKHLEQSLATVHFQQWMTSLLMFKGRARSGRVLVYSYIQDFSIYWTSPWRLGKHCLQYLSPYPNLCSAGASQNNAEPWLSPPKSLICRSDSRPETLCTTWCGAIWTPQHHLWSSLAKVVYSESNEAFSNTLQPLAHTVNTGDGWAHDWHFKETISHVRSVELPSR